MLRKLNEITDSPRFLQITIILLTVLLAVMVVQNQGKMNEQSSSLTNPLDEIIVGRQITPVSLTTLDGTDFNFSSLHGDHVLLVFFATSCPYCAKDIALWQQMYEQGIVHHISILGVTAETNVKDIAEYARKNNVKFPLLIGKQQELFDQLKVNVTPTKILFSPDWHVLQVWQGWTTQQSGQSELGGIYAFFGIAPDTLPVGPPLGSSLNPVSVFNP